MLAALVNHVANLVGVKFSSHEIKPKGSQTILQLPDGTDPIELHGEHDGSFLRLLWNHRYDRAMVSFLQCVEDIRKHIKTLDPEFEPPYVISDDKIGNLSVKLQFNADDNWTKALKYLLTNIKFIVGWVSLNQDSFNKDNVASDFEDSMEEGLIDDDYEMMDAPADEGTNTTSTVTEGI
eukprot:TRINITY_DN1357_c0_g1_i3.p1 TRINITY_DN1357_c0_g1~~TRINITY_DN1357_c0_g1_i3.p1  ORF type:complete len:179 (-),score=33.01 TRINITY_DN1357_c0_g1_i3:302-838(-)